MGFWELVASVEPYANNQHLTAHPDAQRSVKALKAQTIYKTNNMHDTRSL